jgi:hypothetical protein
MPYTFSVTGFCTPLTFYPTLTEFHQPVRVPAAYMGIMISRIILTTEYGTGYRTEYGLGMPSPSVECHTYIRTTPWWKNTTNSEKSIFGITHHNSLKNICQRPQ